MFCFLGLNKSFEIIKIDIKKKKKTETRFLTKKEGKKKNKEKRDETWR